jgi:hypothetical protein
VRRRVASPIASRCGADGLGRDTVLRRLPITATVETTRPARITLTSW